jgi:integrase
VPVGDPHLFLPKFKAGTCGASAHSLRHTFGTHIVNATSRCEWCRRSLAAPAKIACLYLQLAREDANR